MAPSFAPAGVKVREQPSSQQHAGLFQVPKTLLTAPSLFSLTVSIIVIDAKLSWFPNANRSPLRFQGISSTNRDLFNRNSWLKLAEAFAAD